jgi:predicted nucleic acid-binding Zn ribbon protein
MEVLIHRSFTMKKVTPNPPPSSSDDQPRIPPDVIFTVRPGLSTEAALSNASEMLESATVCAYDCAEHLDGQSRKQVLAMVQMIEIAQLLVDEALNRESPAA